jgi:hypothetical protein
MPKPLVRYFYRFYFECPDPDCQTGMIYVCKDFERRQDKELQAPQEGQCSTCDQKSSPIDADKAVRRTVEQRKNGKWSMLRILGNQGEEWNSGPSA